MGMKHSGISQPVCVDPSLAILSLSDTIFLTIGKPR